MRLKQCFGVFFIPVLIGIICAAIMGCGDDDNPSDSSGIGGANDYATDVGPCAVTGVDIDNDDDIDLAVANAFSDNFSILTNDGHGNFGVAANYATGDCPSSIIGADYNGDGVADIVTSNSQSYDAYVRFGRPEFVPAFWMEQFPQSELDASKWIYNAGGVVSDSSLNPPSAKYALKLEGGGDTVVSAVIDLTGKEATVVSYYYQQGGGFDAPDTEDKLWVDFLNDLDEWVTVDTLRGKGISSNTFTEVIIPLPDWAIHSGFQLRVRTSPPTYGRDVWFVDAIAVGKYVFPDGYFDAGAAPRSLCGADFDDDDSLDFIAANYFFGTVSIFENKGMLKTGSWVFDKTDYNAGNCPISVHIADLDNDEDIDAAVANTGSDNVSVLLNNGNGSFAAPVNYECGDSPYSVICALLDNDEYYDLAVINRRSDNMSVFINNGDGTFGDETVYECGNSPCFVYAHDIDGQDGPDLIVCNRDSKSLTVFYNDGDGMFNSEADYGTTYSPYSVYCEDLDGNSTGDIVVTYKDSYMISIFFNNGAGNLSAAVSYDMSR